MTLLQLQYFSVLARVLQYTHAAEELHISQPTLSYSIRELEKELDVKLFTKKNRKITLTESGERFLPYVQKSLNLLDEGTGMLKQISGTAQMSVKLGYFHSISASLIPALVEKVYHGSDTSRIRFQFTEGTSFDIFNQLKRGELDLAFCAHRDDWADSITIMKQPLYLAVPFEHPLAKRPSVEFDDFAREPMVMLDKPSSLRMLTDRIFTRRGVIPNVVFEVRECNAALHRENLAAFRYVLSRSRDQAPSVWAAWGSVIELRDYLPRCVEDLIAAGEEYNARWFTAGPRSKKGHPHHPLYLKKDSVLEPFEDLRDYCARLQL